MVGVGGVAAAAGPVSSPAQAGSATGFPFASRRTPTSAARTGNPERGRLRHNHHTLTPPRLYPP